MMDDPDRLVRMNMKPLTPEEIREIWHEVEKLMKQGQHLKATMLYNTFFPEVGR